MFGGRASAAIRVTPQGAFARRCRARQHRALQHAGHPQVLGTWCHLLDLLRRKLPSRVPRRTGRALDAASGPGEAAHLGEFAAEPAGDILPDLIGSGDGGVGVDLRMVTPSRPNTVREPVRGCGNGG